MKAPQALTRLLKSEGSYLVQDAHSSVPFYETLITNQLQLPGLRCVADEGTSSLNEVTLNGSYFLRYTTLFFHRSSQNKILFNQFSGSSLWANESTPSF